MTTESENTIDYAAVLADLEAKRDALNSAISSLRTFLFASSDGRPGESGLPVTAQSGGIHGGEIPAGAFLRKSIPEASKLYLSIVKAKKTTREIADALRKGGMETTSDNFEGIVHAGLNRAMKKSGAFLRVGGAWALPEWYPAGIRVAQEKRENQRTRKPKRARSKQISLLALPEKAGEHPTGKGHHPGKLSERAVEFINSYPGEEFTAIQLSKEFGIHSKVISMTLAKPVKQGLIKMPAPSTYTAART